MMQSLFAFALLGIVYAAIYYFVTELENTIGNKIFSFVSDLFMMILFALAFFCVLLGYNNAQMRFYYILFVAAGFVLYNLSLHRLLSPIAKLFFRFLQRLTRRFKKF